MIVTSQFGFEMNESACRGVFCPHCGETVAERTFRKHKSQFYNERSKIWSIIAGSGKCVESSSSDSDDVGSRAETVLFLVFEYNFTMLTLAE